MKLKISAIARRLATAAAGAAPAIVVDLVGAAGFCAFVHGLAEIYEPLGWIVGGLLAIAVAFVVNRAGKRPG